MNRKNKKKYFREIEIQDVFLDKLAKADKEREEVSKRKLEVPLAKVNFIVLFLLGVLVFSIIISVTFNLQVYGKEKYTALALRNKFIGFNITSERGVIYDRNMKQLVRNEASFDLWLDKSIFQKEELSLMPQKIKEISKIIDEDIYDIYEKIYQAKEEIVLIKKSLNHRELILLETRKEEISGFRVKKRILRHYEELSSLGHILGYLGKITPEESESFMAQGYALGDSVGKEGVERVYESALKEQKGQIKIERTANGEILSQQVVEYPKSGKALVLSIDLDLQSKVEEVLSNTIKQAEAKKGAVIIMNPNNGEVLASVSLPGFDNNLFSGGISIEEFKRLNEDENNPQLNRVTSGYYPPGSTIKPFIAFAGLSEGIIAENTSLYAPLELCVPNIYSDTADCFHDNAFHGYTDVKRAIAESVNPFFYMVGGGYKRPEKSSEYFNPNLPENFKGLGVVKINDYLELFGFGSKTGVDLPSEVKGRVLTPEWKENYFSTAELQMWYLGDTYNLSIGQGNLLATPLQLAVAVSAIANDGRIITPSIVKQIINPVTKEVQETGTQELGNIEDDPYILKIIQQGMRQTVASGAGSASRLNDLSVKVAAKTGTAQIYPKKEIYHNWITVFAPYENPEIVMVVLVESVEGLRVVAQTAAKEILRYYFNEEYILEEE